MVSIIRRSTTIPLVSTSMYVVAASAQLLFDAYPTNPAFGFSMTRKLRAAYAGSAFRLRKDTGGAEADIGFSGNLVDAAAAATHLSGDTGTIVTIYEQSGSGFPDLTQGNSVLQPAYSASAFLSKPAINADGSNDTLAAIVDLSAYISTQGTIFSVAQQIDARNIVASLFGWDGGAGNILGCYAPYSDDIIYFDFGTATGTGRVSATQPGGYENAPHILELYRDSSDEQGIVVDGSSIVTGTRTADITTASASFTFLSIAGGGLFGGYLAELVGWGTDLGSSGRAGARTNINAHHAVF